MVTRAAGERPPVIPLTGQLDRYIVRSLCRPLLLLTAAIGLAMLLERGLRLLQEMTALALHPGYFLPLLAWLVPYYLTQAVPAALVAGLIISITRMTLGREWEAMAASGVPPRRTAWSMTAVAGMLSLATLLVSGWLEPVGRHGYRSLHAVALQDHRQLSVQPQGVYAFDDHAMLTADLVHGSTAFGLFMWIRDRDGSELTATAQSARIGVGGGEGRLALQLTDGRLVAGTHRTVEFNRLALDHALAATNPHRRRGQDARELTLSELVRLGPVDTARLGANPVQAEIYGRLAHSLTLIVLPWIVLPLLLHRRGRRRWLPTIAIIGLAVAFYHSVNMNRHLVAAGAMDVRAAGLLSLALPLAAALILWNLCAGGPAPSPAGVRPGAPLLGQGGHSPGRRPGRPGRVLTVYLARRLLVTTLLVLAGLVVLLQSVDLLERGAGIVKAGRGLSGFAAYAWLKLPATLLQAAPLAMLGGAIITLLRMRQTNELAATSALAVSPSSLFRRMAPVPLLLGLGAVATAEFWAPSSQIALANLVDTDPPAAGALAEAGPTWFRLGGNIVRVGAVGPDAQSLSDVRIYRRDSAGDLVGRMSARRADWAGDEWRLQGTQQWQPFPRPVDPNARAAAGSLRIEGLTPAALRSFGAAPIPLSGYDAWLAHQSLVPANRAPSLYQTFMAAGVGRALAPLVMLILAVAMIARPEMEVGMDGSSLALGVAGLCFLAAQGYCEIMGHLGTLPPLAAVSLAPALFGGAGLIIIFFRSAHRGTKRLPTRAVAA